MKRLRALFIVLVAGILVSSITIYPKNSLAVPLEVEVLGSTYTMFVYTKWYDPPTRETSRTQTSSTPIGDYMYDEATLGSSTYSAEASAEADLFEVTVFGSTKLWLALASAQSEMTFSPLLDGTANLTVDFGRYYDYGFTEGYVSLFDLTSNQELWNYGWDHGQGNVPWDGGSSANLTLDTYFANDHTYYLSMFAGMDSNGDSELVKIGLSGLEIVSVPEPSTMLLLGMVLVGLVGLRGKFTNYLVSIRRWGIKV